MSTTRRMRVASLCSRKRELTREGPLPLVAAPQAITQGPDATVKKKKEGSLLVIAHTPKRNLSSPITQNDLAGSKRLFNYFDSVFAIGQSARDPNLRYVKQLKARSTEILYDASNVIVYEKAKDEGFLSFHLIGYAKEYEHLREPVGKDQELRRQQVAQLRDEGKSMREIASELGLSKSTVGRLLKET